MSVVLPRLRGQSRNSDRFHRRKRGVRINVDERFGPASQSDESMVWRKAGLDVGSVMPREQRDLFNVRSMGSSCPLAQLLSLSDPLYSIARRGQVVEGDGFDALRGGVEP